MHDKFLTLWAARVTWLIINSVDGSQIAGCGMGDVSKYEKREKEMKHGLNGPIHPKIICQRVFRKKKNQSGIKFT